jgi:ABC-type sugar transport system substrate-binding protein
MNPLRRLLVLLAALALLLSACGGGGETGSEATEEPTSPAPEAEASEEASPTDSESTAGGGDYTIGVSLASPTIPLYVAMAEGMRQKAEELGVELVFTEANEDPVQQLNDVQDLIAQSVDGILISPIDAEAAIPAYEAARAADIPIMSIARNTDPQYETSFIGAAWEEYGRQIAEWTCEEAGGQGTVAMVKGPAGASFVEDMEDGYKAFLESDCPGMSVVFETNASPLTVDQGLAAAQDALTANPDVTAIFANNDDLAAGALQALAEQGKAPEDVVVTGFDGTPEGVELVGNGELDMTIALRPQSWGELGLQTMVDHLNGEEVPPLVEIETLLVDSSNVEGLTEEDTA